MAIDSLNLDVLAAEFGKQSDLGKWIATHPGIKKLIAKAIKQDWLSSEQGKANFQRELQKTKWFQRNASWARGYLLAEAQGGPDFDAKRESAREIIRARATALGANLSDEALDTFTTAYFMNGWGEEGREVFLDRALSGQLEDFDTNFVDFEAGGPDSVISRLRKTAMANGIEFSDGYYESAYKSIVGGFTTLQDYEAEMRQKAAELVPVYADRIKAGENLEDIASPYISTMANILELNPADVRVNDKWIKQALSQVDDKGNPVPMSLWDFQKALKQDERWQFTKNAHDEVGNVASRIVSMFTGVSQ